MRAISYFLEFLRNGVHNEKAYEEEVEKVHLNQEYNESVK